MVQDRDLKKVFIEIWRIKKVLYRTKYFCKMILYHIWGTFWILLRTFKDSWDNNLRTHSGPFFLSKESFLTCRQLASSFPISGCGRQFYPYHPLVGWSLYTFSLTGLELYRLLVLKFLAQRNPLITALHLTPSDIGLHDLWMDTIHR